MKLQNKMRLWKQITELELHVQVYAYIVQCGVCVWVIVSEIVISVGTCCQ